MNMVEIKNMELAYGKKSLFNNFNLDVSEQEMLAITGESGSGKSTLLNIIGLLLEPTFGEKSHFGHKNVRVGSALARNILRYKIGYLFQNYALLENQTVLENMKMASRYAKLKSPDFAIKDALSMVGLHGLDHQKVFQLSGGEQQRLALARLIIKPCELILADEPTGNLDESNTKQVMHILSELRGKGKTIVMVTHDNDLLEYFDREVTLGKD